jgi:hypothetical protein
MILMQRGLAASLLLMLAFLCGCGSDGRGARLVPVTGRVIFKNEGVTAANIFFLPDAAKGNNGTMASAILQTDGSFTMETYPKGEGVAPGAYKVTLDLPHRKEAELAMFRKVETTPLSFDVPEEGLKDLVIDLGAESARAKDAKGKK